MPTKYVRVLKKKNKEEKKVEEREPDKHIKKVNTLLCSTDNYPLVKWSKYVKCGYVKRVSDSEIEGKVIELSGSVTGVWISLPKVIDQVIGITYPWLFFIIKAIPDKQLVIDIQVMDSNSMKRTFRFDTKTTLTKLRHMVAWLDLSIKPGYWNCLEMDLQHLVSKNYCTRFTQLCRIQIHGCCKLRRIYSASCFITQEELPAEYKVIPVANLSEPINKLDSTN
ncbi:uncharacterized protein [Halyomorpha halys]|uniref:uncharacterized protein n=1 Tax=Halyomorpha halys TaxID=286706 RepID=UPI0006D51C4D|nr:cilia- and flagella-associated protein 20-like [Halyomorpha halys]